MVSVSGSMPEGWWSAKLPCRFTTASLPPGMRGPGFWSALEGGPSGALHPATTERSLRAAAFFPCTGFSASAGLPPGATGGRNGRSSRNTSSTAGPLSSGCAEPL